MSKPLSNPNKYDTAALQRRDSAHYMHPFTDTQQLAAQGARIITHADGV
jgi:putrescine---pyruvate transaminase